MSASYAVAPRANVAEVEAETGPPTSAELTDTVTVTRSSTAGEGDSAAPEEEPPEAVAPDDDVLDESPEDETDAASCPVVPLCAVAAGVPDDDSAF